MSGNAKPSPGHPSKVWIIAALWLGLPASAAHAAPPSEPPRSAPPGQAEVPPGVPDAGPRRAPEPRRGERYDGRSQKALGREPAAVAHQALLAPPRRLFTLVMTAWMTVVGHLELWGVFHWLKRILYPFDGRLRVLPVGGFRSDLTPVAGFFVATDLLFGPRHRAGLDAELAYGNRDVWRATLRFQPLGLQLTGRPRLKRHSRYNLALLFHTARRNDLPFYGVGYQRHTWLSYPVRAVLGTEVLQVTASMSARVHRVFRLSLSLGLDSRLLSDGRAGEDPRPLSEAYGTSWPAWNRRLTAFAGTLTATLGTLRRIKSIPQPGVRAVGTVTVYAGEPEIGRLLTAKGQLEAFVGWYGGLRLLGVRGSVTGVENLYGRQVPLLYMHTLGGAETMRGFSGGRFRGESIAWLATEYWVALHPGLWLSLFIDWGGAFRRRFTGGGLDRIDVSGGGALALRLSDGLWAWLQVAGSREGPQVIFTIKAGP